MIETLDRIKQIILTNLEISGQFTPEQQEALAQAITAGMEAFQAELQASARQLQAEHAGESPEQSR